MGLLLHPSIFIAVETEALTFHLGLCVARFLSGLAREGSLLNPGSGPRHAVGIIFAGVWIIHLCVDFMKCDMCKMFMNILSFHSARD